MIKELIEKKDFSPYPALASLPVVIVSSGEYDENNTRKSNVLAIAWCGIINSDKPKLYVSIMDKRYSYGIIKEKKELVVNLVSKEMLKVLDFVGCRSGRDIDKIKEMKLNLEKAKIVKAPIIAESPLNIECKVDKILALGSHYMFICDIVNVKVSKDKIDKKGRICYEKMGLISYAHGEYFSIGKKLGTFGFSVKKKKKVRK